VPKLTDEEWTLVHQKRDEEVSVEITAERERETERNRKTDR
jgi:hypothetical protein